MPNEEKDLAASIRKNASGPKAASGDMGSVTEHSLQDQIAADKYLAGKKAQKAGGLGVRLFKIAAPSGPGGQ